MGATPSVTAALVERTPYRLRYLLTSSGQIGSAVLTNANQLAVASGTLIGGVDLRVNALAAAEHGTLGLPLLEKLATPAANQSTARQVLMGGGLKGEHGSIDCRLTQRGFGVAPSVWLLDANEGAAAGDANSAGFAVLVITPPDVIGHEAYLDIHLRRTETR